MFTRLLIGLDGSAPADEALEQAVLLGRRFGATLVVGHVREGIKGGKPGAADGDELLERARARVASAGGVAVETVLRRGKPEIELAALARNVDVVLLGRRGGTAEEGALGSTVSALIRIAERCVIVCGGKPSPMRACAVAYDGRETSQRALALAGRFASIAPSELHIIHATIDPAVGTMVVGEAEAKLSLQGVAYVTHIEHGTPGDAVARVVRRIKCDALFVGAHVARHGTEVSASHAEEILRHTDIPVVIQP
jgi:nucleotide-binding universal stress UspA family protein